MMDERRREAAEPQDQYRGMVRVVRPTLVAAIGGTGAAAAKAAKARIEAFAGPDHHYIAYRAFDAAFQDNRLPRFVDNAEFVYLGGFNAQSVIMDIITGQSFFHWEKWMAPRLNFQQVAFGAGGIRPIGRLCYFYRRDLVEEAVKDALATITNSDKALRFHQRTGIKVNLEAGIDIHVVCSVCGGTGAGMFLDLAFDIRRWAEEVTDREVSVTGHLVLPEAFRNRPVVVRALEANAYVALHELDRFMNATSSDAWQAEYTKGRVEKSLRAPFDNCYLLSGLQQGGTSDVDTLTAVIGEAIMLSSLFQVGQKVSEGVINMAGQRKATRDEHGRLCCYSSYGVLGLEIPRDLLAESLGPELARVTRDRLSYEAPEEEGERARIQRQFREQMRLQVDRVEEAAPRATLNLTRVEILRGDLRKKDQPAREELKNQLAQARQQFEFDLERAREEILWSPDTLRDILDEWRSHLLDQEGGLRRFLRHIEGVLTELETFKQELHSHAAQADEESKNVAGVAQTLGSGHLGRRKWQAIYEDVERWRDHFRAIAVADMSRVSEVQIDRLIRVVKQDYLEVWRVIEQRFRDFRLADPRNEDLYYQHNQNQARTSICPLDYFRARLEPYLEKLVKEMLRSLARDAHKWATIPGTELAAEFHTLCLRAIRNHYRGETGMDCDALLAECFGYPSEKYKTEVTVMLSRARANWEIHESYAMRDNRLEIASVGVDLEAKLFEMIRNSYRQMTPVEEQRTEYVPIFRTEHGLSLVGLKRLAAYRDSLNASVIQEQRYDVHFFSDRRWVTQMEFPGEDTEELGRLFVFSAAEMIGRIRREPNFDYSYVGQNEPVRLGRYRREAFLSMSRNCEMLKTLQQEVHDATIAEPKWFERLSAHLEGLADKIVALFKDHRGPSRGKSETALSQDVYQVHAEIRALRAHMRVEDPGL